MSEVLEGFPPDPGHCERAAVWFAALRDRLCAAFEAIEDELAAERPEDGPAGRFERTPWQRPGGGGGTISVMRGRVFEKVGVNISTVCGEFSPEFRNDIPGAAADPRFWAGGISLVAHLRSPLVPAVHMNTRHIVTSKAWFGGGSDLTPIYPDAAAEQAFHAALAAACAGYDPDCHARFKAWCDEYFFLEHRGEARGAGGIFFDYLDSGDWERDFAFVRAVGEAFARGLSGDRAVAHAPAMDRRAAAPSARAPRPLCRIQPALRPRHPVRAEDRRQCRGDPDVVAARSGLALAAAVRPAGSPRAARRRRAGGQRSTSPRPRPARADRRRRRFRPLARRTAETDDIIDRAPAQERGGVLQVALLPALAQLAFDQPHVGDDVAHALAGVAGQLIREIAQHLRGHQPPQAREIAGAPGLLDRRMQLLERLKIGIGEVDVAAAIATGRRRRRSRRARPRPPPPHRASRRRTRGGTAAPPARSAPRSAQSTPASPTAEPMPPPAPCALAPCPNSHEPNSSAGEPGQKRMALQKAAAGSGGGWAGGVAGAPAIGGCGVRLRFSGCAPLFSQLRDPRLPMLDGRPPKEPPRPRFGERGRQRQEGAAQQRQDNAPVQSGSRHGLIRPDAGIAVRLDMVRTRPGESASAQYRGAPAGRRGERFA